MENPDLEAATESLRAEVAKFPEDESEGVHFAQLNRGDARAILSALERLRAVALCDDCARTVELKRALHAVRLLGVTLCNFIDQEIGPVEKKESGGVLPRDIVRGG